MKNTKIYRFICVLIVQLAAGISNGMSATTCTDVTPSIRFVTFGRVYYCEGELTPIGGAQGKYSVLIYANAEKMWTLDGSASALTRVLHEENIDMKHLESRERFATSIIQLYVGLLKRPLTRAYFIAHADAAAEDASVLNILSKVCNDPVLHIANNGWQVTGYVMQSGVSRPRIEKITMTGSIVPMTISSILVEEIDFQGRVFFMHPEPS